MTSESVAPTHALCTKRECGNDAIWSLYGEITLVQVCSEHLVESAEAFIAREGFQGVTLYRRRFGDGKTLACELPVLGTSTSATGTEAGRMRHFRAGEPPC